ncbi:MAG TPA: hypothetical protein VFO93_15920 [Hymenobacter sp.]|uniref:hypothetical protein n=1 Tax=Hymenobacter sp. TaxID=1898978 RepID=UPI002D800045|nr:hypothetical protein [Hymenobacter sp.]HET9505030.1 hypothetical protein [Hymenobacter sp.]
MQPAFTILPAALADVPALAALINQAYRGVPSAQGWTTEAHLLDGPRRASAKIICKRCCCRRAASEQRCSNTWPTTLF